jgi:hypothetical protein
MSLSFGDIIVEAKGIINPGKNALLIWPVIIPNSFSQKGLES